MSHPNSVTRADGFHISYNDVDVHHYGAVTTALVPADHSRFYILNGDHGAALIALRPRGLVACLEYLRQRADQLNHRSDPLPEA